jgi:DNA topoisomerase-1
MSEMRINILDASRAVNGTLHGFLADAVLAGLAAEPETTDRKCPECGRPMAVKAGKRGRFLACTGYPECKTTQPNPIGAPCGRPGCEGELVERRSPRGSVFYSCNKYPECRFSVNERPYRETCDKCNKAHFFVGTGVKKRVLCCEDKECKFANAAAPTEAEAAD